MVNKLEKELRRYRAQPFLQEGFEGVRRFQKELVDALRGGGVLSNEEIPSRLRIDPSEHEAVKALLRQLDILQAHGIVRSSPMGGRRVE